MWGGASGVIVLVGVVAVVAGGCSDEAIDGVLWACAGDRECGPEATCERGLCVPRPVPELRGGLVCEQPAGVMPAARFAIDVVGGARVLVFAAGGASVSYPLPDEVARLDDAPIAGCCASPCCEVGESPE